MSLYQRLKGHAQFYPDKTAIESEQGHLSYRQLQVQVDQCSAYFMEQGLRPGDRVALLSLNNPDWFIALFAAAQSGIVLVPLNWRLSVEELCFVVDDCAPTLLLHDVEFADTADKLRAHVGAGAKNDKPLALQSIGTAAFPPIMGSAASIEDKPASMTNALLIVYTSGTTGRPKGAVLSQQALLCSAAMSQHMLDLVPDDRVLNVLPLFHVGGLNIQPLPTLLYGATLVLHSRFIAEDAVQALQHHGITLVNTVPTILQAIVATDACSSGDCPSLRAISIGSTDVPVGLIRQVHKRGIPLIQVYGATETGPVAIYQRIDQHFLEGSIGRAGLLCDIRLANESGEVVPDGESGEIEVRGNNILTCYWNNPEATESSFRGQWFRTGDVAHRDSDGFYWFDDRVKHVVISGGENIYPAELERIIREVDGVVEVAVVGKPDERWGEVPVAVVASDGVAESELSEAIQKACSSIAKFKQPRDVIFVEALPRNALGKVVVHKVRQLPGL